jgi:uroporphyrinogen-III synthase
VNGDPNVPTAETSSKRATPKLGRVNRGPLEGYTIGVTADRRADEQMKLLAGRGAECLHGPVIKTHPVGSEDEMQAATQLLLDNPPDMVIFTTGLGVRGWLEAADAVRIGDELRDVFGQAELLARGPKATGALVTVGFEVAWTAPRARYDDITELLSTRDMHGSRVAVQLDGAGAKELCDQIEAMGADVVRVPVYRWSLPADSSDAERLIRAVVERRVDALTFTAKPAVENFLEIAGFMSVVDEVVEVIDSGQVRVFCVGPVCATGITEAGLPEPFVPVRHRLGAMVQQVAQYFATQGEDVQMAGTRVRVQGRLALIDGCKAAWLTDRERALLTALLDRPGAVLSKPELLRRVWRGAETDEHLVEVTVARLRQRLGSASDGIETVVRRGYRVSAV